MSGQGVSKRRRRPPTRFRDGSALARADGRAREIRAVRDGARAIIEDQGGESAVSFLARRTAIRVMFLDGLLAKDEITIADGKEIDRSAYVKTCLVWLRYVGQLGLGRRAKPVQSLDSIRAEYQTGAKLEQPAPEPCEGCYGTGGPSKSCAACGGTGQRRKKETGGDGTS